MDKEMKEQNGFVMLGIPIDNGIEYINSLYFADKIESIDKDGCKIIVTLKRKVKENG